MKTRLTRLPALAFALAALALAGCGREKSVIDEPAPATPPVSAPVPFRVTALDLGNAIDASKRIASPTRTFAPSDTIYATVLSEGAAPRVDLVAKWTYQDGQVVSESTQSLAPEGPAATEFHIAMPSGWPAGKYKVEITANGAAAASTEFEVR
jgi:hypothetical protein